MSPVFLCVEIPSSPGPAGQRNDSLLISCVCLSVCGARVSVSVCTCWCTECEYGCVFIYLYIYMYVECVCVCACKSLCASLRCEWVYLRYSDF